MAEVYWIRLPEHTDMFTQGYIGVTTKTAQERFTAHVNASKLNKKHHLKISYAIRKYGAENLVVQTLVICDDSYSLELEEKLRPHKEIGWNLAKGGSKPPVREGKMSAEFCKAISDRNKGVAKSQETRNKISEALVGHNYSTPESIEKAKATFHKNFTSQGKKRKPPPLETRLSTADKVRKEVIPDQHFWRNARFNISKDVLDKWELCSSADLMFNHFKVNLGCVSCRSIASVLTLDGNIKAVRRNIGKYLSYFKAGWVPLEDPFWVEDFKEGQDVS